MRLDESHPLMVRRQRRAERSNAEADGAITDRLHALDEVITAGEGRLGAELLDPGRELARQAGERLRLSGSHTVVALAGATGSGKSSVFNAMAGSDLSTVGVRRPTTSAAHAVIWGAEGAGPLLDWLQVPRRHYLDLVAHADDGDHSLDGLVLLDLPDHDSTAVAHRLEVDRLVDMVDVLVWVLDPQKYADAAVHERYLRPLAGHADVMVVVLNQADRLSTHHAEAALDDVRRLLADDGLGPVPVLATSAVTAGGLDGLRAVLVDAVAAHRAVLRRVANDLDTVSSGLAGTVAGPAPDSLDHSAVTGLTDALVAATGIPAVGTAVRQAYVHRASVATGSPFLRWLQRLRPDPLRHLPRGRDAGSGSDSDSLVGPYAEPDPIAEPAPTAVESPRVDLAVRTLADHVSEDLPDPWPDAVRAAGRSRTDELVAALDRAVAGTELGPDKKPVWWRVFGALQAMVTVAAIAGGLWLVAPFAYAVLGSPVPATPMVGPVPLPAVLLVGGVLAGLLIALLARLLAQLVAGRRASRAEAHLRTAAAEIADELVVAPVRAELAAYGSLRSALERLRGH